MESVVKRRHTKSYNDTSKHTHLQCLNTKDTCHGTAEHIGSNRAVRQDGPVNLKHCVDGNVHDKKRYHRRKCRYFLFFLCHTDCHTYGKDNRQVVKNRISRFCHNRE